MSLPDSLSCILPVGWAERYIPLWLQEDCPAFDIAGAICSNALGESESKAILYGKSNGKLAGKPVFNGIFKYLGCQVEWFVSEGYLIEGKQELAIVRGPVQNILAGERIALNMIARLSGIATKAASMQQRAKQCGFQGVVAGSRKTTPGLRLFEKYAMMVGGCDPHRYDLSSMVMIKDNAIDACGCIKSAISKAKALASFSTKIEVECRTEADALDAASSGVDIIMLDNFLPEVAAEVAQKVKAMHPNILIEVSGGIKLENIDQYCSPHIDIISSGSITQDFTCVDFSLKIKNN